MRSASVTIALMLSLTLNTQAAVLFVDANGANPISPYVSWSTAATNIQDAINAAAAFDTILVTNGLYQLAGPSGGALFVPNKGLTLQSVNGPALTTIRGQGQPFGRCVYLYEGNTLSGFTLTNGAAGSNPGGGIYCTGPNAVVTNCVIVGNSASLGGGIYSGKVFNCIISNNTATGDGGGGAAACMLRNCTIAANSAGSGSGGGINGYSAFNCLICSNRAGHFGGGAAAGMVNCRLIGNVAQVSGGGASSSYLTNCVLIGNLTGYEGGGAAGGVLVGCLVIGNVSTNYGGGVSDEGVKRAR